MDKTKMTNQIKKFEEFLIVDQGLGKTTVGGYAADVTSASVISATYSRSLLSSSHVCIARNSSSVCLTMRSCLVAVNRPSAFDKRQRPVLATV
jgi:hypothetical protein